MNTEHLYLAIMEQNKLDHPFIHFKKLIVSERQFSGNYAAKAE